jgi:negative regulator of sigma E activity
MSSSSQIESRERLSALLDGEVTDAELNQILRELDERPSLRESWNRLCRARAVMEGVDVSSHVDICSGVMAAVRESGGISERAAEKVVPLKPRRHGWSPWRTLSIAAAASIAAVATVISVRLHQGSLEEGAATPVAAAVAPAAAVAAAAPSAITVPTAAAAIDPDSQNLLDDFVIEHSNYRVVQMGPPLSYARFAAHTVTFSPDDGQR